MGCCCCCLIFQPPNVATFQSQKMEKEQNADLQSKFHKIDIAFVRHTACEKTNDTLSRGTLANCPREIQENLNNLENRNTGTVPWSPPLFMVSCNQRQSICFCSHAEMSIQVFHLLAPCPSSMHTVSVLSPDTLWDHATAGLLSSVGLVL